MAFKYTGHTDHEKRDLGTGAVSCPVEADSVNEKGEKVKVLHDEIVARVYPSDDGKSPRIDFCCPMKVNSAKEIADLVQAKWKPEVAPVVMANEVDRLKAQLKAAGIEPAA